MIKKQLYPIYWLILILYGLVIYLFYQESPTEGQRVESVENPSRTYIGAAEPQAPRVKIFEIPNNATFAGEKVPISKPDIHERFEREIYVNAYWESNTLLMMKRAGKFLPTIEKILANNGIPDDFKYIALIESGLMNVVSPAGARGFWQFMEGTAKERGLEISGEVDERYNFEKSTQAACKYLQLAYAKFGNWTSVAASYNMGISGLAKRKNEQQIPDYYDLLLNEETSRYIFRILAFKEIFENPSKFGFELQKDDLYSMPLLRELVVENSIKDLAIWSKKHNSNYKELKIYNPWLRTNSLNIKSGKSYRILLPA